MEHTGTISDKAQLASYTFSKIVTKKIPSHTIVEEVILPACKETVNRMLGKNAE